jgi:hypothetical protein
MTMDAHTLTPSATLARKAKTPFPGESAEYRKAREALLAEEIEFRRHMTRLTDQRRALPPGPVIAKNYRFKDGNGAEVGFKDLFGKHDTLFSYFSMFGPQRERPCPMCTNWLGAVTATPPTSRSVWRSRCSAARRCRGSLRSRRSAAGTTSISCRRSATTTPGTSVR